MTARPWKLPIGELSRHTGVHIETIRYYEKIGLLPSPLRSEGRHRLYGSNDLKRLTFIRRGRELGFSLEEIRTLLKLVNGGDYTCNEVKTMTLQHLQHVREKMADLRRLEEALAHISAQCEGGYTSDCPIIEALFETRRS